MKAVLILNLEGGQVQFGELESVQEVMDTLRDFNGAMQARAQLVVPQTQVVVEPQPNRQQRRHP